jgi:hypothetical protein
MDCNTPQFIPMERSVVQGMKQHQPLPQKNQKQNLYLKYNLFFLAK